MHNDEKKFRLDINALRAYAVVAVVFYHFQVPGFATGGFVGVDIFFVISGYLMTKILFCNLQNHSDFDKVWLFKFYNDRAIRILPALLFLIVVLLTFGWFLLPSPDYRSLGKQSLSALTFLSNIQFWHEAGYFDLSSHEKWLLHTWSLSVEWQFYLFIPLIMAAVWRFFPSRRGISIAIFVLFLISLSLSIFFTPNNSDAAFYLLYTRAWEMLAGGLVFLVATNDISGLKVAKRLEFFGFGLIALSIFALDVKESWPGYIALIPVIGASFVILAARQNSLMTNNPIVQKIGLYSYSIYLWHWPVLGVLVYMGYQNISLFVILGLFLTLFFATFSYCLVEKTSNQYLKKIEVSRGSGLLGLLALGVLVFCFYIRSSHGVPSRLPPEVEIAANESLNINPLRHKCHIANGNQFKSCVYGGGDIKVLLVGDSHASSLVSAIQASLPSPRYGVLAFTYSSCPTIFGVKHNRSDIKCAEFNDWVLAELRKQPSDIPLVIVNRASAYVFGSHILNDPSYNKPSIFFYNKFNQPTKEFLSEFQQRMVASTCELAKSRPVYLVRPIPEMPVNVPKFTAKQLMLGRSPEVHVSWKEYQKRNSFVWKIQDQASEKCGAKIVDITPSLCPNGICMGLFNNRPLYYDEHHLSLFGSSFLKKLSIH